MIKIFINKLFTKLFFSMQIVLPSFYEARIYHKKNKTYTQRYCQGMQKQVNKPLEPEK